MENKVEPNTMADASVTRGAGMGEDVTVSGRYTMTCVDENGVVKWTDDFSNLVTTVGKNNLLDAYLGASTQTTTWYMGLISSTSYTAVAAGDSMSSHTGWLEAGATYNPTYSQSARPSVSWSAASSGSKATSSAVSFSITSSGTVKGAFLNSVSTKDGGTGVLYSAGLFTGGDKVVSSGDTVNVTYTASA